MTVFYCRYWDGSDNDNEFGENGYRVVSRDRQFPNYFNVVCDGSSIAHDITDHITHNPNIDPEIDEMVALGVAYYRTADERILTGDIVNVWSDWHERCDYEYQEYEDALADLVPIKYTSKNVEQIEEDVSYQFGKLELEYKGHSFGRFLQANKDFLIGQTSKAMSRGYRLAQRVYRNPDNCQAVYDIIKGFIDSNTQKQSSYYGGRKYTVVTPDSYEFKFVVTPSRGYVECFKKEQYERFWY